MIQLSKVPIITQEDIFRPGEDVYIQISTQFPNFIGMIHKHTFIELTYVISGSGTHVVGDRSSMATKGDLFIINYDTPHAFFCNHNDKEPFVTYDLLFTPKFFDIGLISDMQFESINSSFLLYSLFPNRQIGPDVHIMGTSYNTFGDLFNKIYVEFNGRENGYISLIRAYVVELIIKIFRKMSSTPHMESLARQTQIVNTTIAYLRKNYHKPLSSNDLAAQVLLSKDYFTRLFKEITGMPINYLIQKIRIDEACKLLKSTNDKVIDIAGQCGFSSIKNFYSAFHKITGLTPGQYRLSCSKALLSQQEDSQT